MYKQMYKLPREVTIGSVKIGGNNNIAIQSMTNTKTTDVEATVKQIKQLYTAGADLVRVAILDKKALEAFKQIREQITKPLIADIHFDYRLAVSAFEAGAEKVRINPGNIGDWSKVLKVVDVAKEHNACIRVGVNSGSLDKKLLQKYGSPTSEALAQSALEYDKKLLDYGFSNFVMAIKSSNVKRNIEANRIFAKESDTPLHLGVTEAGTPDIGNIKSAIGIGSLLCDGIGSTFRVTLTADPVVEIGTALNILKSTGLRKTGLEIISCPTCGRTQSDLISIVNEVKAKTKHITTPLTIAIMGCVVNGPGEAREVDLGLALGKGKAALFKHGKVVKTILEQDYVTCLLQEIEDLCK
ncbi:flavodoxin-dependent (E)-4-hydroxy-3-methylbut-2-enyl-diphosphate synthase [Clostridium sp. 'deep sea']|uniref:flavodoxin-dependent (E)-4-hydroxy-3-methylbut-2-enyl-diphosphate synthase n=1 Tax=Clostridium sp. 'deep sea' TaxID=2779445 RepID=UPI001A9BEFBE|nr:flavodoxin-dependent (E)-4-hydroxy-3-methylbut-2-enyl-diphosphate synthase [Clostridium sp. 'deep sea']